MRAWGDLQIHPDGFRAAQACPSALARTGSVTTQQLARLARRYQVPIVDVSALQSIAQEFGTAAPMDQRVIDDAALLTRLANALKARERCRPNVDLLGPTYGEFCQSVLALLAHNPGCPLLPAMRSAWAARDLPGHASPAAGIEALRHAVTEALLAGALSAEMVPTALQLLDAAHGPVTEIIEQLAERGEAGLISDRYLLHPRMPPPVRCHALQRARLVLALPAALRGVTGAQALLTLEPELDESDVRRLVLEMQGSPYVERLIRQARERRPQIARVALERRDGTGITAAARELGRSSRSALLRHLRHCPWPFSLRRDPEIDRIVGDNALRIACERQLRLARNATDVVNALGLLPSDEARDGLERMLAHLDRLTPSAAGYLPRSTWNEICCRPHLLRLLTDKTVRRALDNPHIGFTCHARLLRAHPDADHGAAKRLWRDGGLIPMFAADALRASGPQWLSLAREALAHADSAKTDDDAAARLAAALVVLAERDALPVEAAAMRVDCDLPATVRAVACFLFGCPPGDDPMLRRYREWETLHREKPASILGVIGGSWQEEVLL